MSADDTLETLIDFPYSVDTIFQLPREIGRAVAGFPLGQRQWFFKQLSGFSATGKVMKRRKDGTIVYAPYA